MATAIEISGVTRRFRDTVAVDRLSLDVAAGEIFALVGPDGAGKTTLIRLICGALSPDAGELHVDGVDAVRQSARVQAMIGYMPQRFTGTFSACRERNSGRGRSRCSMNLRSRRSAGG